MTKKKDGFSFLGLEFQERLLKQFLEDRRFTERIVDIIDPNYFTDPSLKVVAVTIKNAHERYEAIPDAESLKMRIRDTVDNDIRLGLILEQIDRIINASENDALYVQDRAIKFCKQQELIKSVHDIQKIIDRGDEDAYDECSDLIRRALEAGDLTEDDSNVLEGLQEVLSADYRKPISTGIMGLDELMDGGLSRGELALILAPFGVGKTTMITKLANSAMDDGHNVLQIFFEDTTKVIKRKHLSCWTKIPLNELSDPQWRDTLDEVIEAKGKGKGRLILKKFPSDGTTIPKIRAYLKKKISQGFRPDILLLDYIDCVVPTKEFKDEYAGEGNVMRQFESMLSEFDIAGWTAVQGNRCLRLDTEIQTVRLGKCEIKDVIEGDEILTHSGYKKITNVFPITKQVVYKIKTKSGKEIFVSAKHEFPVKYGKLRSISTGLSVGDKLLSKKKKK